MIEEVDGDGDGSIDFEEFERMMVLRRDWLKENGGPDVGAIGMKDVAEDLKKDMREGAASLSKFGSGNILEKLSLDIQREGYGWDLAMMFHPPKLDESGKESAGYLKFKETGECNEEYPCLSPEANQIIDQLRDQKIECLLYHGKQNNKENRVVFCLLRLPLAAMKQEADSIDYLLPLDAENLRRRAEQGYYEALDGVFSNIIKPYIQVTPEQIRGFPYIEGAEELPLEETGEEKIFIPGKEAGVVHEYNYCGLKKKPDGVTIDMAHDEETMLDAIHNDRDAQVFYAGKLMQDPDFVQKVRYLEKNPPKHELVHPGVKLYKRAILHDADITPWEPFQYIYGKYDTSPILQELYSTQVVTDSEPALRHPFGDVARMNILLQLINKIRFKLWEIDPRTNKKVQKGYNVTELQKARTHIKNKETKQVMMDFIPLHNGTTLDVLRERWISNLAFPFYGVAPPLPFLWTFKDYVPYMFDVLDVDDPKLSAFTEFRNYFGEKIALYISFLSHYMAWMRIAAFFGFCFTWGIVASGRFDNPELPFFALAMIMWAVMMLEYWKRTEIQLQCKWGTSEFENDESERPEFVGRMQWNHIAVPGDPRAMYFAGDERSTRLRFSNSIMMLLFFLVFGLVFTCFAIRASMMRAEEPYGETFKAGNFPDGAIVGSVLNVMQISFMEMVFEVVARRLTNNENHRTDTEYEDSLIFKTFLFQVVNSYAALTYLAFFQQYLDRGIQGLDCHGPECVSKLVVSLTMMMVSKMSGTNAGEVAGPWVIQYAEKKLPNMLGVRKPTPENEAYANCPIEKQFHMKPYDMIHDSIKDYTELAQQFG
jgi:hypothetical protein